MENKFSKLISTIANICQIAIVILAIFEYNIHIKPNFQNQLLSEENARLIIENNKIKENSEQIQTNINSLLLEKQQELESLQNELQDKISKLEATSKKLTTIEKEQKQNEEEVIREKEKEKIITSISNFKELLTNKCGKSRSEKIFIELLNYFSYEASEKEIDEKSFPYSFPLQNTDILIKEYFYNPYVIIYKSLDNIQTENINNKNKQNDDYLTTFKKILKEKEKYILFDEKRVITLENNLKKYAKQKEMLEKTKDNSKDYSLRTQLLDEIFDIEHKAKDEISELENELIDYKDIIDPVINEMINIYLKKLQ